MAANGDEEEFTSFTTIFYQNEEIEELIQEAWPTVRSALEEHGISCALNMVEGQSEGSIRVSTTPKTRDPNIIHRARWFTELVSKEFPVTQAIEILEDKLKSATFKFDNPRSILRRRYTEKKFLEQWNAFYSYWECALQYSIGRELLYKVLGCFMFVPEKFTVLVIGPPQAMKEVRRIVINYMEWSRSCLLQLQDLRCIVDKQEEVVHNLFHQFGVESIMEAVSFMKEPLIFREEMNASFARALLNMQDATMVEMIADKCRSFDSPEVRANAADTLYAIVKFAPPELATRISIRSLTGRLLQQALEHSQPQYVLVNFLARCISLLDPKEQHFGTYDYICEHHNTHGSTVITNPEIVMSMVDTLGDLLKILDDSSVDNMLLTTYGRLQPPLGMHRLKIVEFISVLLRLGSEAAEKELVCLGVVPRVLDLLFKYPFNNFLHHLVEKIIESCLESRNTPLVQHVLYECDIVGKILEAEQNFTLAAESNKPTVPADSRSPPRRGNIGHLTRISNKICELGNKNKEIEAYLQENTEWTDWYKNVLSKRMAKENLDQWACGRPALPQDGGGDGERKRRRLVALDIDGS